VGHSFIVDVNDCHPTNTPFPYGRGSLVDGGGLQKNAWGGVNRWLCRFRRVFSGIVAFRWYDTVSVSKLLYTQRV